jgi:hypothetical protein
VDLPVQEDVRLELDRAAVVPPHRTGGELMGEKFEHPKDEMPADVARTIYVDMEQTPAADASAFEESIEQVDTPHTGGPNCPACAEVLAEERLIGLPNTPSRVMAYRLVLEEFTVEVKHTPGSLLFNESPEMVKDTIERVGMVEGAQPIYLSNDPEISMLLFRCAEMGVEEAVAFSRLEEESPEAQLLARLARVSAAAEEARAKEAAEDLLDNGDDLASGWPATGGMPSTAGRSSSTTDAS